MISLIFKIIILFFFTIFISFVFQMVMTFFKLKRSIKEQQKQTRSSQGQNYANSSPSGKQDINAEYRVVDKDKK